MSPEPDATLTSWRKHRPPKGGDGPVRRGVSALGQGLRAPRQAGGVGAATRGHDGAAVHPGSHELASTHILPRRVAVVKCVVGARVLLRAAVAAHVRRQGLRLQFLYKCPAQQLLFYQGFCVSAWNQVRNLEFFQKIEKSKEGVGDGWSLLYGDPPTNAGTS